MDPFRDELAAAHAKIAQLENHVRELEAAARRNGPPPLEGQKSSASVVLVAMVVGIFLICGGVTSFLLSRGAASTSDPTYRGIATATPPQAAAPVPAIIDPGATSSAKATPSAKSNAKACNCVPGDPLCSCL